MGKVLGIAYRATATHLTHKAGYAKTTAHTGAVTLIQRFGGSLNLNDLLDTLSRRIVRVLERREALTHRTPRAPPDSQQVLNLT